MTNRKKMMLVTLACAVALVAAGLAGVLSPLTNTTKTLAATPSNAEPPAEGCSAVTVTDIKNENVGLTLGEKVTVSWSFTPPPGVGGGCVDVEGFKVKIEVTRRTGRKSDRTVDTNASARSTNVNFTEAGDKIKSITATVTARFSGAATATRTENSDN